MTPSAFIAKWKRTTLPERAASHEHFIDLCRLLNQPTPAEHDAAGEEYTFEKGVAVTDAASKGSKGDRGFADVWWRGKFGWEYKRKDKYKTLDEAYRQLCQYREALENPPLLIVSDISRIQIHTSFTGTKKELIEIPLDGLGHPDSLDKLRRVFTDPDSFKPSLTTWKLTENVAADFAKIADGLRQRGHEPHVAAHFLMKCMFCLFAEDTLLLPDKLFSKLVQRGRADPAKLSARMTELFGIMREGGDFGVDAIRHFNGGLFDEAPALELSAAEIHNMLVAAEHDWSAVEPSIFGTLFERSLDPNKRAQIGAHYTSRDDIMLIVEPVVMAPLRREWEAVQAEVRALVGKRSAAGTKAAKNKINSAITKKLEDFVSRLSSIRILDPACGSGNFLFVAIQELLKLEKDVIVFGSHPDVQLAAALYPQVRPTQLHGIEINPYAAELAQVVIWIGFLQWMKDNGFATLDKPILSPLTTIENRDAILNLTIPTKPQPAKWPEADFIIGNPPFLGVRLFRKQGLDDAYIQNMYDAYPDLPNSIDLCCYWFELARAAIAERAGTRAGLLATQGIRGGDNRTVLERIKDNGDIFMAWSDREWILDGAAVHVSMIGFDDGSEATATLDGLIVKHINADLTADVPASDAESLEENRDIAFMGDTKGGAFDLDLADARSMLADPNPNGRSNLDVVRPWVNGLDFTRRNRAVWIVDFGCEMSETEAAAYSRAFEWVVFHVKPIRVQNRRESYAKRYWIHVEPRPAMRAALPRDRFLATPNVTKHRLFVFVDGKTLPDHQLIAFARSDDYFFGVLHSSLHELWALRMGTQLEDRPRYTPTTCFETFPLPWPPGKEPKPQDAAHGGPALQRIADAARELNEQRERWLNPPEWIDFIARQVDAEDDFADVPQDARPLIRQSAIMAAAAKDPRLKKRTLTNLYNERPTWLRLAHEKLDRAVLAAYALADPEGGWAEDWAEVWLDSGAGQPLPAAKDGTPHPLTARRAEIDQRVLGNLLRMNLARADQTNNR